MATKHYNCDECGVEMIEVDSGNSFHPYRRKKNPKVKECSEFKGWAKRRR